MEKKKVFIMATAGILVGILGAGCVVSNLNSDNTSKTTSTSKSEAEKPRETYEESMKKLNSAKTIEIQKDLISFGKSYEIKIDGKEFGDVDGDFIKLTGDKFEFRNKDGVLISSEKQIKRWGIKLNRLAEVYDSKGQTVGFIGEEKLNNLFKLGFSFHFYDKNKAEIGYLRQDVFNILSEFDIKNSKDDKLAYTIKANFNPIQATYTITVHDSSVIPVDQAIFMTCIINAVNTAKKEENKKVRDTAAAGVGAVTGAALDSKAKKDAEKKKKQEEEKKKVTVDLNKKPTTTKKPATTKKPTTSSKSKTTSKTKK